MSGQRGRPAPLPKDVFMQTRLVQKQRLVAVFRLDLLDRPAAAAAPPQPEQDNDEGDGKHTTHGDADDDARVDAAAAGLLLICCVGG